MRPLSANSYIWNQVLLVFISWFSFLIRVTVCLVCNKLCYSFLRTWGLISIMTETYLIPWGGSDIMEFWWWLCQFVSYGGSQVNLLPLCWKIACFLGVLSNWVILLCHLMAHFFSINALSSSFLSVFRLCNLALISWLPPKHDSLLAHIFCFCQWAIRWGQPQL